MGARVRLLIIGFIALGSLARTVFGDVTLFSTNFGDNYICNGDAVIIDCTTDTGVLRWLYGPNSVLLNTGSTDADTLGVFSVTFVIEGQVITSTATSNLTSELVNETSIECHDAITSGADKRMVTLYIAGPPGPPIDFMNVSSTFSSVTLSWLAPLVFGSGVNVTSYDIEITQPDGISCSPNQCLLSSSDLTTTIDNLASNVEYTFSITASTCGGIGSNASLSVYVEGRAPDPPMQLEACISLENSGTQLNLQATWQCPDVDNDIFVPPIVNYRVSVAPYSDSNSAAYEKSILADCRCAYSTGVFIDEAETLYNIGVSSNNSIGSGNEKRIPIYSSANISSEVTQIMSSSILLAISVSWQACPGTMANIIVTYSSVGSSALPLSVMTEVTLPASRVFIPLNNLILGTMYKYSVALESNGGLTLGLEEEMTFETNSDNNIIVQTVCTSRSRQEYTQQLEPTTSLAASEKCSSNSTTSLLIGICVIGVMLLVALSLFVVTLMCYIRTKYKAEHSDYATVSTPPSIVLKNENWTTNMNQSYGQCSEIDTHFGTNSYKTPPPETYEEIRSSAIAANTNPEFETPRPPAELPTLPVYVDPNTNENMEEKEQSRRSVANPSYGKSEKELISTPEDYLIVTDSKKINVYD